MKSHDADATPKAGKPEDLRVFLSLGLPIFLITLSAAALVILWGPGHGQ